MALGRSLGDRIDRRYFEKSLAVEYIPPELHDVKFVISTRDTLLTEYQLLVVGPSRWDHME